MKLAIAAAYFGKLPNTAKYWLQSCGYNDWIDFYLITDQTVDKLPKNVFLVESSAKDFERRVKDKLDIDCDLSGRTYKMCDYRPLFNQIYSEVLGPYAYFGQCELDMVFGDIGRFLDAATIQKYQKLFHYGHFTIYKNDGFLLRSLDVPFGGGYTYRGLLEKRELCNADEQFHPYSINRLYDKLNIPIFGEADRHIADIAQEWHRFVLWNHQSRDAYEEKGKHIIFSWENGRLIGHALVDGRAKREEYLYIHLQKRRMEDCTRGLKKKYIIVPNQFLPYRAIDKKMVQQYSRTKLFYRQWFRAHANGIRLRLKRKLTKDYASYEVGVYRKR